MSRFSVGFSLFLIATISLSASIPIDSLLEVSDSELVGSKLSKVYAPAPFDDLEPAGSGEKNRGESTGGHDEEDGGFYTSKSKKGDNGYKHFDSYHKKGGDKYGYEAHSSFGKSSGGKKGGSHKTGGHYHKAGEDGKSHEGYYHGEDSGKHNKKDHKEAATDGDFHYSNYESDGEGDSEHFEDSEHYDGDDGGHYSEGYTDDESSEGYYEGEGDSEGYYDGEGETKQKTVIHHGGPARGATSYSVRHY